MIFPKGENLLVIKHLINGKYPHTFVEIRTSDERRMPPRNDDFNILFAKNFLEMREFSIFALFRF